MPIKLAMPVPLARKRAALRLLRAREACGISQERLAEAIGCSKRQLGSIERGRVRDIGLEALNYLLEGGRHAASWEKPRGSIYELSHQTKLSDPGAHSGLYEAVDSVVGGGAETSALMPSTRNTGGECVASSNGQERQRNTRACPMSCSPLRPRVQGGSPWCSAFSSCNQQTKNSAQQQESAGRPAPEARCASESIAELGGPVTQPTSFPRRRAA